MPAKINRRGFLAAVSAALLADNAYAHDHLNLPDGEITRSGGITAKLVNPTKRYQHAVLGDDIEAGGFSITRGGKNQTYRLGDDAVFEDRRVRLWDIDGDGEPEAVIVKAYLNRGAAIAVYRLGANGITELAESPAIGSRNRWLNPVGAGDFTGNGQIQIAAVITPHLTGSLRLYALSGNALVEVARTDGYTNHIIGSRDLDLGKVVRANDGLRIIIPTLDRRSLAMLGFRGGSFGLLAQKQVRSRIVTLGAVSTETADVTLENGQRVKISFL